MGIRRLIIGLFVVPHLAVAEEAVLSCTGSNPEWTLDYDGSSAQFDFAGRKSDMEVPQKSTALGAEWPRAATLIAPRDSAIILYEPSQCDGEDIKMHILTRRGESPILLTGCCSIQD